MIKQHKGIENRGDEDRDDLQNVFSGYFRKAVYYLEPLGSHGTQE